MTPCSFDDMLQSQTSAKGQWVCFNGYEDLRDPGPKIAQNGSENGSGGYSEAPESIPMVSDRSDFWPFLNGL